MLYNNDNNRVQYIFIVKFLFFLVPNIYIILQVIFLKIAHLRVNKVIAKGDVDVDLFWMQSNFSIV